MYEAMLENNKRPNSSNYRDAAEGLSRCCVNLGEFERGLKITTEMFVKTNPANQEHMSNCLNLLIDIYMKSSQNLMAACALITLLEGYTNHPQYWKKLGEVFQRLENLEMVCYCILKAQWLHISVEKTVTGFAKDKNKEDQTYLSTLLEDFDLEMRTRLDETVKASIFGKSLKEEKASSEEFVDLGSSKLRKEKEESVAKRQSSCIPLHPPKWIHDLSSAQDFIDVFTKNCLQR